MTQNQSLSILGQIAPANTGTAGQVLTSNGTSNSYWSTISAGVNTAAQYSWTNTHTFNANLVISNTSDIILSTNAGIYANSSFGTTGQVLTSNGTTAYWATASGGGGFTNGQSISVANLAITGSLTANGSVGTSGQALVSTGTGVQWGALSPGYNYSSQFNGTNQYLSSSTTNALAFGTGDYTVECWFYLSNTSGSKIIIEGSATNAFYLRYGTSYGVNNGLGVGKALASDNENCSYTFVTNTWYHVAVVRQSNVIKFFVNGVQQTTVGTGTSSFNYGNETTTWIGGTTSAEMFAGNISNLRVLKGTALYTANFTPPTSPLSAISGTSLLTCNAITPSDSSTNNFQITNNGGVTTSAVQSPFTSTTVSIPTASLTAVRQQFTGDGSTTSFAVAGGYTPNAISVFVNGVLLRNGTEVTVTNGSTIVFAIAPLSGALIDVVGTVPTTYSSITPVSYSVGFNGSTQYLSVPSGTFVFGLNNFTVEAWIYTTAYNTSGNGGESIIDNWTGSPSGSYNTGQWQIEILSTGILKFFYTTSASAYSAIGLSTIPLNTWVHIAAVRNSSNLSVYVNGVLSESATLSTSSIGVSGVSNIGKQTAGNPYYFTGYISNVRVVNGVAVYTGAFMPPQTPLAAVQSASGTSIQTITGTQTSLLTCNGPTIIDGSTNAFTITNNGSAPVSTAIVPTFTNVTINNNAGSTLYYNIQYLIVAGGGGGGGGGADFDAAGGGGAGGFLVGTAVLNFSTVYTITVGSGGVGGTNTGTVGTQGSNSLISGIATSIGGGYGAKSAIAGGNGGSGGGGGSIGYSAGTGVTGQGYAGGTGNAWGGGGGGGATAVGGNGSGGGGTGVGGNGGAGAVSYITGSAVTYAGGGGGGTDRGGTVGTGGSGGGGNAGTSNGGNGTAGTVNTGGGGGAGSFSTTTGYAGGSGGSGVVILSVPTTNYSGITTGSPTVTTSGGFTVIKFTASGSYTA